MMDESAVRGLSSHLFEFVLPAPTCAIKVTCSNCQELFFRLVFPTSRSALFARGTKLPKQGRKVDKWNDRKQSLWIAATPLDILCGSSAW